jgi:hypothetical protein
MLQRRVNYAECVCPDVAGADEWPLENRGLRRNPALPGEDGAEEGKMYRVDEHLHPQELSGQPRSVLPGVPASYTRVSVPRHHVVLPLAGPTGRLADPQPNVMNLSQHCVPGWGASALPSVVKPKRAVGLSAATDSHRMYTDPDLSEALEHAGRR